MAKKTTKRDRDLTQREKGAAFLAWYKQAMEDIPGGLITRAQAAEVLGISRTAVTRLLGRGHLRARYFPKEPDVEQVEVSYDDPFWIRLMGVVGPIVDDPESVVWVKACYVSLEDVIKLWEAGEAKEKARLTWRQLLESDAKRAARWKKGGAGTE
jgi:hypothetical protein